MKRIISMLLAIVILATSLSVLSGCGKPKDDGAQFNIYLGYSVLDFDPSDYYVDSQQEQVMGLLYESLFRIDEDGKLECALAEDYKVNEEKREITITLRESYWSDEVRVMAQDFVYAWCERILNPNNPNPAAALFYDIENAAAVKSGKGSVSDIGVRATGTFELTITYRRGVDYNRLLKNLASVAAAPVRRDIVDTAPTHWSKMINTMVFNGPFKVEKYDIETGEFTLSRNRGYHQDPAAKKFDKFVTPGKMYTVFTALGEKITLSTSDIENKTHFFMTEAPLSDRAANKDDFKTAEDTSTYTYVFNLEHPLFAIKEVRQALTMAIDRDAIANAVTFGIAADGFVPNLCGGSEKTLVSTNYNKAKELLAGVDFTGISKEFTIKHAATEEETKIAAMVSQVWTSLGFTVYTEAVGAEENTVGSDKFFDSGIQSIVKEASYGNRDFDVIGIDWQFYSLDSLAGLAALTSSMNGSGMDFATNKVRGNIAGYADINYDGLIAEAVRKNGDDRQALLELAEEQLCSEAVICPIIYNETFVFVSSELKKLEIDGLGNIVATKAKLKNYENYYPKKETK